MFDLIGSIMELIGSLPWETIVAIPAVGYLISAVMQKFKKWFSLQSPWFINIVMVTLSGLGALLDFLLTGGVALLNIPEYSLAITTVANLVYHAPHVGVKSLTNLLGEVKDYRAKHQQNTDPETVQPVAPATVEDFAS